MPPARRDFRVACSSPGRRQTRPPRVEGEELGIKEMKVPVKKLSFFTGPFTSLIVNSSPSTAASWSRPIQVASASVRSYLELGGVYRSIE